MGDLDTTLLERMINKEVKKIISGGGGSGYNGDMEARISKIETVLDGINTRLGTVEGDIRGLGGKVDRNFNWKVGLLVTSILTIVGAISFTSNNLGTKIDNLSFSLGNKIDTINEKITPIQVSLEKLNGKIDVVNQKADDIKPNHH